MAGIIAIRCDLNDAPYVWDAYERQGFIPGRSFAVLVFHDARKPSSKAPARDTEDH